MIEHTYQLLLRLLVDNAMGLLCIHRFGHKVAKVQPIDVHEASVILNWPERDLETIPRQFLEPLAPHLTQIRRIRLSRAFRR